MSLPPLPPQPADAPWPTQDWPHGALQRVDGVAFDGLVAEAFANGYDGQYTLIAPDRDLIIVRHGVTALAIKDNLKAWMGKLAACFS